MPTYNGTLSSHGHGCGITYIAVGSNPVDAIRQTFARRWPETKIISISRPYNNETYHVEHTGRDYPVAWYMGQPSQTEHCTSDDISDLIEVPEF